MSYSTTICQQGEHKITFDKDRKKLVCYVCGIELDDKLQPGGEFYLPQEMLEEARSHMNRSWFQRKKERWEETFYLIFKGQFYVVRNGTKNPGVPSELFLNVHKKIWSSNALDATILGFFRATLVCLLMRYAYRTHSAYTFSLITIQDAAFMSAIIKGPTLTKSDFR